METEYHQEVRIPVSGTELEGELVVPAGAKAIVIFSHGSGSSRKSPRNQLVAEGLHKHHMGTLLFDLLTEEEDKTYFNRFNIDLLALRLINVTQWLQKLPQAAGCSFGYFGASTGAASALRAAAVLTEVKAVVSRGGRPDMAMGVLHHVKAAVLLIVGSLDYDVIQLNEKAYAQLICEKDLKIINGASHLFEEPGTLDKVADEAINWFKKYLVHIEEKV
jgi:putative phosphoribosyl transferase